VLACACKCRPASISSIWRADVVGYFWEKPQELIQSQFCYQRCSSEIRYSTKPPRTAADALHSENEVGAAANSLNQHKAYTTHTPVTDRSLWSCNAKHSRIHRSSNCMPNYLQKVG